MRTCPFKGCGARIAPNMFSCKKHWFTLSEADRNRIWWAFNQYRANDMTVEELREIQQSVLGERGVA